eukprot:CAMPEP_0174713222 /NCGR_PEP_ID=MMETSP1094-20130205/13971_1 /TAXON_ID=156173 /ORGANISM="Chrysochromulina brevifilum, Strain UTEX LB 985" /LENGTH=43 /DNA_ID= /DNA_START= /DNA_END= /DNA_ORIENTATION=
MLGSSRGGSTDSGGKPGGGGGSLGVDDSLPDVSLREELPKNAS